jgi:hypothetical protein
MRRSALITSVMLILAGGALFGSSSLAGAKNAGAGAKRASTLKAQVGIGDEQPTTFGNPAFLALHTRIARYVTPYDVATNHSQNDLPRLRAWLAGAARDHIQPLIAFYHSDTSPKKMPSVKTYTADVKRFLRMFPQVRTLQPWNEANRGYVSAGHGSYQSPTASQSAQYYLALRGVCHGCTVVGLDVLDSTDVSATVNYIKVFKRALHGHALPTIWGLHNYSDTNRFHSTGTRAVLAATSGQVWLTETGGIAKLAGDFPFNLSRQVRATRYMFQLAGTSNRITRLYIFQWTGGHVAKERFDAGLSDYKGRPRPAFCAVYEQLRHSKKCPFKTVSD